MISLQIPHTMKISRSLGALVLSALTRCLRSLPCTCSLRPECDGSYDEELSYCSSYVDVSWTKRRIALANEVMFNKFEEFSIQGANSNQMSDFDRFAGVPVTICWCGWR
ncbi:uncharacterized protein V1518DRAFT_80864 [Limtongia smithiae]|uniref:uncharacterized protein n=1 Tax=Limtongia smithiae TaxID=1125753 RepID=UPI0034CE3AC6